MACRYIGFLHSMLLDAIRVLRTRGWAGDRAVGIRRFARTKGAQASRPLVLSSGRCLRLLDYRLSGRHGVWAGQTTADPPDEHRSAGEIHRGVVRDRHQPFQHCSCSRRRGLSRECLPRYSFAIDHGSATRRRTHRVLGFAYFHAGISRFAVRFRLGAHALARACSLVCNSHITGEPLAHVLPRLFPTKACNRNDSGRRAAPGRKSRVCVHSAQWLLPESPQAPQPCPSAAPFEPTGHSLPRAAPTGNQLAVVGRRVDRRAVEHSERGRSDGWSVTEAAPKVPRPHPAQHRHSSPDSDVGLATVRCCNPAFTGWSHRPIRARHPRLRSRRTLRSAR